MSEQVDRLKKRFEQADIEQKQSILTEAQSGEKGLELLWHALENDNLSVRSHAYSLFKSAGINSSALELGIPLKVGDRIYGVYQSCVQYNEECEYPRYYIRHYVDSRNEFPFYRPDITENGEAFEYVSDAPEHSPKHNDFGFCNSRLICYCVEKARAEGIAKVAYIDKFKSLPCGIIDLTDYPIDEFEENDQVLKAWAKAHDIQIAEGIDKVASTHPTWNRSGAWQYYLCLLTSLHQQKQFNLLRELWELSKRRPLGFVQEYIIDRDCYLRLSENQSG